MADERIELEKLAIEYNIKVTKNMKNDTIHDKINRAIELKKILMEQIRTLGFEPSEDMSIEEMELFIKEKSEKIKSKETFNGDLLFDELTDDSKKLDLVRDDLQLAKGRIDILKKRVDSIKFEIKSIRDKESIIELDEADRILLDKKEKELTEAERQIEDKKESIVELPKQIKKMIIEIESKIKKANRILLEREVKNNNRKSNFFEVEIPKFLEKFEKLESEIFIESKEIKRAITKLNSIRSVINFGTNELEATRIKLGISEPKLQTNHKKIIGSKLKDIKKYLSRKLK